MGKRGLRYVIVTYFTAVFWPTWHFTYDPNGCSTSKPVHDDSSALPPDPGGRGRGVSLGCRRRSPPRRPCRARARWCAPCYPPTLTYPCVGCVVSTFVCTHPLTYDPYVVGWSYDKHMEATSPRYTHRWCVLGRTAHCGRSNSTRGPIARMPIRGRQYGRETVHVDRPRYGHRVLRRIGELPITGSAHQEPPLRRGFSLCVRLDIRPSMS